ncbi:hypothetical protein SSP531S_01730 [Streptomyces spongiicola]|uniref:Uncharacterized protein n=1 Tax=Streptomyces spongiicola TaxID=1690221 RepID=A0A388SSN8_9ACTN|nr:hypothetical protein SSP531S_01730 [Streptomyces spongiicola]
MVIIAVSAIGLDTDIQMPIPTPPTRPAAAPQTACTGMTAVLGDTCIVAAMVSAPSCGSGVCLWRSTLGAAPAAGM